MFNIIYYNDSTKKRGKYSKTCFDKYNIWVVYDLLCKAYTGAISDIITLISTIIGIYRFDIKKNNG